MSKNPNNAGVITVKAPAKVNLGLRILGRRADGYHEVLSLMVPVSLYDEVRLEPGANGIELRCPESALPTGEENLVHRAARLVLDACRSREAVRLELRKRIPVGAGLGGGSSDAAATLLGMNELLGGPFSDEALLRLGVQLGADVPFFLLRGPALAEGIGDRLTPVDGVPALWTLLIYPDFQVSTRWAYENLPLTTGANGSRLYVSGEAFASATDIYRRQIVNGKKLGLKELLPLLDNDFEPLIFSRYPQLHGIRQALLGAGAAAAPMTGSGPTLAGLFPSLEKARAAQEQLGRREGISVFLVQTLSSGRGPLGAAYDTR